MERSAAVVAGFLLVSCGGGGGGSGGVAWDDAAGDVKPFANKPDQPRLDIVRVEASGKDGALRVRVKLKDSLERHFGYVGPDGRSPAGVAAHLYLDTDNNANTGGHPEEKQVKERKLQGYDYRISLQLGYRYGDEKSGIATAFGDIAVERAKHAKVEPLAVFALAKLRQGTSSIEFVRLPEGSRETALKSTSWKGDTIEAAIPYGWIGLKGGETVRLCFYERDGGAAPDKGYSDDKVLKLSP